ncbi:hypothetical protein ES332_A01G000600v1 [Gossypium tomentosum]|uniref:Uncharacterized protein n=1 Tax=Gossypium tomentosum TaxID=34277 RepID=A0A5D2RLB6_GOSTO|nr:hypothetical protein ES332_A01G000600v1 [Gossypium tomentosum]
MNNIDFYLCSPGMSPAIKLHRFFPSSSVEFWLRSTPGSLLVILYQSRQWCFGISQL